MLSGLLPLASLQLSARTIPVIASVVLHASIAAGLVASAGGHARARGEAEAPVAAAEVTVDVATALAEEPVVVPALAQPLAAAKHDDPPPTHTHPYPVDPSHDAHPHDPSMHHDEAREATAAHDHEAAPAAAPAEAAPALTAEGSPLPRFDLSAGSGTPMGARVASSGAGTGGADPNGASTGSDDVVHSASSVQVSARLVQSVTAAYPIHAREDEAEGDVGVEIVVDREGRVIDARVTRPAGHGFDAAALAAIRAYRFSPAQREGHAVRVRMPWSVQFRLR